MPKKINYNPYLDDYCALGPTPENPNSSFNNIVFSGQFLLAEKKLGLHPNFESLVTKHLNFTNDEFNGYKPKNSHDNIIWKMACLKALGREEEINTMNYWELAKGKHPRDMILFGFLIKEGFSKLPFLLLMWFPMFEIVRGILNRGKVRPAFWDSLDTLKFRLKASLGFYEEISSEQSPYHIDDVSIMYRVDGGNRPVHYMMNDGKHLSLARLYLLNSYIIFKPFIYICKLLYKFKLGKRYQSLIFDRFFRSQNHPVQQIYHILDDENKSIL